MGASVTAYKGFWNNSGEEFASGTQWAGYLLDTQDPSQFPENFGRNMRFTIHTDAYGGNRVDISGLVKKQDFSQPLRLDVNRDAECCKKGGKGGVALADDGTGGMDVRLSPDTDYYVWLFNWEGYGSDPSSYSKRYEMADPGSVVTVSGSWGTAASPSAPDGCFGQNVPISLTGGSSGASYTLTASYPYGNGRTRSVTLLEDSGQTTVLWTPDLEQEAADLPDSGSVAVTLRCVTKYGEAALPAESTAITLRFAGNSLPPTLNSGWVSAAPLNTGLPGAFGGVFIEGRSKARLSFDSSKISCLHGADVSAVGVSCNGKTVTGHPSQGLLPELDTDVLPGTSAEIVCTVTDSRGQTNSETLTVALQSYRAPTLSGISLFRSDQSGTASEDGTYFSVTATAGFSSLKDGNDTELNSAALAVCSRTLSGSFGTAASLPSGQQNVIGGFDPDTAYELKLAATDALGSTAVYTARFPTRAWAMKFRADGQGVAFGRAPEHQMPALELASGWSLVMYDSQGNSTVLDKTKLDQLLALLT